MQKNPKEKFPNEKFEIFVGKENVKKVTEEIANIYKAIF